MARCRAKALAHGRDRAFLDAIEIAAARDEEAFNADAVGVSEEGGVIAGRPGADFRRANDLGAEIAWMFAVHRRLRASAGGSRNGVGRRAIERTACRDARARRGG